MLYTFKNLITPDEIKVPERDKDVETLSMYLSSYEFVLKMRVSISNHIGALKYSVNAPKEVLNTLERELERYRQIENRLLDKAE
jgi:cell shape-determining protein MreC